MTCVALSVVLGMRSNDKAISTLTLHKPKALARRVYVLPFAVAYAVLAWLLASEQWYVATLIASALVVVAHLLCMLFTIWSVEARTTLNFDTVRVEQLEQATHVKVNPTAFRGAKELCEVVQERGDVLFYFQKRKYQWNAAEKCFEKPKFQVHESFQHYLASAGLTNAQAAALRNVYGENKFDIPLPGFTELYKQQLIAPFFVFQLFCVALWCLDDYWQYSVLTLCMLLMFEGTVVRSRIVNMKRLRDMAHRAPEQIMVYRDAQWLQVPSNELVPGDVCSVVRAKQPGAACPCDLLLLSGTCVVNEAMLTGESTPRMKEGVCGSTLELDASLDIKRHALHLVHAGTEVVQSNAADDAASMLKRVKPSPDRGAIAVVLRTAFETSQGKLLRTILFATERVTANTLESFVFIMFLLVFALVAVAYILQQGLSDPETDLYKLFLHCTLVITSVVPPELPMELTLAVNNSLLALTRLGVFCTEPFRIPFAGKVSVCCFDKTGTLTSDEINFLGVAMYPNANGEPDAHVPVCAPSELPPSAAMVLSGCHSLLFLDGGKPVGDPMELAALHAINQTPGNRRMPKILFRHHFSSVLKRMSTVCAIGESERVVLCKGAPEIVRGLLEHVPPHYDRIVRQFADSGARVLALAWRNVPNVADLKSIPRDELERNLQFAGFALFECPLKSDSKQAIEGLLRSRHQVMMITGDNVLTACHVAEQLGMLSKPALVLSKTVDAEGESVHWRTRRAEENEHLSLSHDLAQLVGEYDLCVSGDTFVEFMTQPGARDQLAYVKIFARVSPAQKEAILNTLKDSGYTTLMCGDGTNDVGALKQAHIGLALLNQDPVRRPAALKAKGAGRAPGATGSTQAATTPTRRARTIQDLLNEMEAEDAASTVKLGDASIASAFTSRGKSVMSALHVIKQGRCTLVTTHQMFKILALNCLISAYTLSVLYLDGIKWGDTQMTTVGILISMCFLFISRSQPLRDLAPKRPADSIFTPYMFLSVIGQFACHLWALVATVQLAKLADPGWTRPARDAEFSANLVNSAVFVVSCSMQISTFAINYQGHPFMQSLFENKPLRNCVAIVMGIVLMCLFEISPGFNEKFDMVRWPSEAFASRMMELVAIDFFGALAIDRGLKMIFRA